MKKYLFICSALALLALVSSCQKEQRTVTLGVSLEQDAKLVIDDNNYPCWSSGDLVHVNGQHDLAVSDISSNGHSAQITGVTESDNGYCVIYPSSLVAEGTTIGSGNVSVEMPGNQYYAEDGNGHQKVELPMGGVSSSTNMTLHNLGSILRVNVTNSLGHSVTLSYIKVTANNARLSGDCTATINGTDQDKIVSSRSGGGDAMDLKIPSSYATIDAGGDKTFSIVLPTFSNPSQITVTVGTTEGGYRHFQTTRTDITLASNQIVNFNANLTSYTGYENASLKGGVQIKTAIQNAIAANSNITAVSFECGATDVTSGTELQGSNSPTKIYGNAVLNTDGQTYTYVISTPASVMRATDCNYMFLTLSSLTSITFGTGFSTEWVVSMSYMFDGCSGLTSLDLSSFNTGRVNNMSYMFSGCSRLTSLNLSNFDMSGVKNKDYMCLGLATECAGNGVYLHYCTITCTTDVQSRLQNGTDLPTYYVTFNWVTPSK